MASELTLTPLPFEEAIAAFRGRLPLGADDYKRLTEEARTQAFGLAGVLREDAAAELYGRTLIALEEGWSQERWTKEARGMLEARGLEGGDRWRLQLAFRNNVQSAHAAGRWAQVQRTRARRPFIMYDAVDDDVTRPTHAAMDGRVFAATDPVWQRWWPPNGHACRCGVRTLSERQVRERGLQVEDGSKLDDIEVGGLAVPLIPDPGWGHNVGRTTWSDTHVARVLEDVGDAGVELAPEVTDAARRDLGIDAGASSRVAADPNGLPVVLGLAALRGLDGAVLELLPKVLDAVTRPREAWAVAERLDDGRVQFVRTYVAADGTAVKVTRGVMTGVAASAERPRPGRDVVHLIKREEG